MLINCVSETIKNEAKEQNRGFLNMLLGTLGANLLGNLVEGKDTIRTGEGTIRAGQDFYATSSFKKFWNIKVLLKWT